MAVIGKIQKNSLLLLIVIGLAMLAFIFTDFLRGGGNDVERLATATLNDEPIDEEAYQDLRERFVERSKNEYAYQQKEWTPSAERVAENNAFNELVRRQILGDEFEKLGIVCTVDELNDMIHGNHVHQWVLQVPVFNGPNGFSKDSVRTFINRIEVEPEGVSDEERENWMEMRRQWKEFENELKETRKADKYVTLIKKGIYTNKLEAQNQYNALYAKKQVKFVMQPYALIPADEVKITDEDIKAYYEKHKNDADYEQEEARDVQMVFFPIEPTPEDVEETKNLLNGLKSSFAVSPNTIGFVYQNSESKFLSDSTRFNMNNGTELAFSSRSLGGSYPESMDDAMQSAKPGDILGPVMAYNSDMQRQEIAIVKVMDVPTQKQAWVRHILISSGAMRTEERAKAIADSLIKVIKAEDNFAALVPQVSEDPGSKDKGGEYKWFAEGVMVPTFNDAAFNGPIGQIQLVKTDFGYHIVEVLGQAERVTPELALVTKMVRPSDNTLRFMEERAYEYIYHISEVEGDSAFNKVALDSNLDVNSARIYLSNEYVIGMKEASRMMKFAFGANTTAGTVSDPILDGDKYVVAIVDNIIEEGTPEFEDVKEAMRAPALRDKQAEVYIAKMSGKSSLEDVGKVLTNGFVRSADVNFDARTIYQGGQNELAVIGKLFTKIPVGKMTVPIQGEEGVYVFTVESETPAPETTDLTVVSGPMTVKRAGVSDAGVITALREKANLVDNRRRIEYQ